VPNNRQQTAMYHKLDRYVSMVG